MRKPRATDTFCVLFPPHKTFIKTDATYGMVRHRFINKIFRMKWISTRTMLLTGSLVSLGDEGVSIFLSNLVQPRHIQLVNFDPNQLAAGKKGIHRSLLLPHAHLSLQCLELIGDELWKGKKRLQLIQKRCANFTHTQTK